MYQESMAQLRRPNEKAILDRISRKARQLGEFGFEVGAAWDVWPESRRAPQLIANQLLSVQENERKRIASDLHDGVGQSLTMIKLCLTETARQLAAGAVTEAAESLQRIKASVHGALEEVRHVAMDLRPPMLDDLGLLPTLSWFFREFGAACPDMRVEKDINIHESDIPHALKLTIFRILQEASSNIMKYAHADLMRVMLRQTGGLLYFSVEDNGDGFDPAEVFVRNGSDRGLGLLSMKERALLSGGVYVMESEAGKGTRICVSWRLDAFESQ